MSRALSRGEEKIIVFLETHRGFYVDTTRLFLDISVREKKHLVDSLAKLRDVTDHLFGAISCVDNEREVDRHLEEATEALKKAGIGVAQAIIEYHLVQITRILKVYTIKRLLYTELPEYNTAQSELADIETGLIDLRHQKGLSDNLGKSLELSIETYRKSISLYRRLTPTKFSLMVKLFVYLFILLAGLFLRPAIDKYVGVFLDREISPTSTPDHTSPLIKITP